jgi:hypothetical protein
MSRPDFSISCRSVRGGAIAIVVGASATLAGCDSCKETPRTQPEPEAGAPTASTAVNVLPVPSGSVAAAVNPGNLPAYRGPTGSVEGFVLVKGDPSPDAPTLDFSKCPSAAPNYKRLFREGPARQDGTRPVADAVVAVIGYSGFFLPEQREAKRLTFADCDFPTHAVTLTFGQRLEVENKTRLVFAPMLEEAPSPALMVAPPELRGDPVRIYAPRPGHFTLTDRMGAGYLKTHVYVLLHPLHTVSSVEGKYRIDGVPVGKLEVHARLPQIQAETKQAVEITADAVAKVDLTLTYTAPKALPDAGVRDAGKPEPKIH